MFTNLDIERGPHIVWTGLFGLLKKVAQEIHLNAPVIASKELVSIQPMKMLDGQRQPAMVCRVGVDWNFRCYDSESYMSEVMWLFFLNDK